MSKSKDCKIHIAHHLPKLLVNLATTPTDKDFYDSLSPALKKRVDAQRSQEDRHKAYADQIKVSNNASFPFRTFD